MRHPQNADGPFYVVNGDCMACGAPELEAPALMSHDESGHCYFHSQPSDHDETNSAIKALWASCCQAIRYSGNNPEILKKLDELGESRCCDARVNRKA